MSVSPKEAARELLARQRALTNIHDYIRYMRREGLPDFHYEPADHHRVIGGTLNKLAASIGFGLKPEEPDPLDRAAISLPPGSAKSFYSSIVFPTFLLARNPATKVLCTNAAESLAEDFARRRRQIMLSPWWQRLSGTSLLSDAKALGFQGTKEGGGIYAFGAGSTIQGIRADALIADDLVTGHEMAGNLALLDKLWNWFISEARARVRPYGIELLIATRWALLDPIGRVLRLTEQNHEDWRYLRMPMVCDSDDDLVGRKLGERLWPEYFTPRMVTDAKRSPLIFQTLYQQNPAVSEYSWVPLDKVQLVPKSEVPDSLRIYVGVDISLHVGKGDFTVIATLGLDENKSLWVLNIIREQMDTKTSAARFLDVCEGGWEEQPVHYAWVENDNASVVWGQMVEQISAQTGQHAPLMMSKMRNKDKEVRAAPLRTLFLQNRVYIVDEPWSQAFIREIAEFPDGRNDDTIDGVGVVAKELRKLTGPLQEIKRKRPTEVKGAVQIVDGKYMTRARFKEMAKISAGGGRRGRL